MKIDEIYLSEVNEKERAGRGRYERPDHCGYTNNIEDAGRFALDDIDTCVERGTPKYKAVRLIDLVPELKTAINPTPHDTAHQVVRALGMDLYTTDPIARKTVQYIETGADIIEVLCASLKLTIESRKELLDKEIHRAREYFPTVFKVEPDIS